MVRWKLVFRRAAIVALIVVVGFVVIFAGRWQVAKRRVNEVAGASASIVSSSTNSRSASARTYMKEPANGEASYIAVMHRAAVDQYGERSEADRAALPPVSKALDEAQVAQLKSLVDTGNARAACVLGVQISKCTHLPGLIRQGISQLETRISQHDRADVAGRNRLDGYLSTSLQSQRQLDTECTGFSVAPDNIAWKYQLQSALMGFEPAMRQFSTWPPFDPTEAGNSIDALAAYLSYAGPFIEALAQRGDLNAVTSANWNYGDYGPNILAAIGQRPFPKDPARALMWAYVREAIMLRQEAVSPGSSSMWGRPGAAVERSEGTVDDAGRLWSRQMADQMLATYEPSAFQPIAQRPQTIPRREMWEEQEATCRE